MNLKSKDIRQLYFWKRGINSIEEIHKMSISFIDKEAIIKKDAKEEKRLTKDQIDAFLTQLSPYLEKNEEYRAFRYENDPQQVTIKFYLEIDFVNHCYFAIKGIHPFKQPYFKEILNLFSNL